MSRGKTIHAAQAALFITVFVIVIMPLIGCSDSLIRIDSFRSSSPYTSEDLDVFIDSVSLGVLDKANVLGILGGPTQIVPQPDGDTFVYRRRAVDRSAISLNSGLIVSAVPGVPLFMDSEISGRDDLLMIRFDEDGILSGVSFYEGITGGQSNRAAYLGEGLRGMIE